MQRVNRFTALLFSLLFAVNSVIGLAVPMVPFMKAGSGLQSQTGHIHPVFTHDSHSDKSFSVDYLIDDDQDDSERDEEVCHFDLFSRWVLCYSKVGRQQLFKPVVRVLYDGQPKKFILHCSLKIAR